MQTLTHNNLARIFFPKYPLKKIRKINNAIDNPTPYDKRISAMMNFGPGNQYFNPFDIYHLGKSDAHRRTNHDLLTGSMAGYAQGGMEGVMIFLLHMQGDQMSNVLRKTVGTRKRDIWEAMFNYFCFPNDPRNVKRKSKGQLF